MTAEAPFKVGDKVRKARGYSFEGYVVSVFPNRSGAIRYVVEHEREQGMLHIYDGKQLVSRP